MTQAQALQLAKKAMFRNSLKAKLSRMEGLRLRLWFPLMIGVFICGGCSGTVANKSHSNSTVQHTAAPLAKGEAAATKVVVAINPAGANDMEAELVGRLGIRDGCVISGITAESIVTLIFPRGTVYDEMTSSIIFSDHRRIAIGERITSGGGFQSFTSAAEASGSGWREGCPLKVFYVNKMERLP